MKKWLMALVALMTGASAFAAGEAVNGTTPVSISELWQALGVDLGTIMTNVFATIAGPIGVVIGVVFVLTILYFVVWLGKSGVKRKIGFQ